MVEDRSLEVGEWRRRLETQLLAQGLAVLPDGAQGVRLAPRAVQGDDELGAEPLPERMGGDQRLDGGQDIGGATVEQLGLDEQLMGDQAKLLEALGLRPGPLLVLISAYAPPRHRCRAAAALLAAAPASLPARREPASVSKCSNLVTSNPPAGNCRT